MQEHNRGPWRLLGDVQSPGGTVSSFDMWAKRPAGQDEGLRWTLRTVFDAVRMRHTSKETAVHNRVKDHYKDWESWCGELGFDDEGFQTPGNKPSLIFSFC